MHGRLASMINKSKKKKKRTYSITHVTYYPLVYSYCFQERTVLPSRKKVLEHDEHDTKIKRSSHTPPPISSGPHRIAVNTWMERWRAEDSTQVRTPHCGLRKGRLTLVETEWRALQQRLHPRQPNLYPLHLRNQGEVANLP